MIKTVTTTAGVNTVTFPEFFKYFWIKNIGDTTVYASAFADVGAGVDNSSVINAGDAVCIENVDNNDVYISGAGSVEIHAQDYPDCSFKVAPKGGEAPDLSAYAKTADVPNIKVNTAVNADTVGEKSADDFAQIIELGWDETDTKTAVGISGKTTIYRCANWTDFPAESPDGQGTLIAVNYIGSGIAGTDRMWVVQFFISARTGIVYKRYIDEIYVGSWCEVYSAGNKPYVTGSATVAANSQICVTNHGFMPSAAIWWDSNGSNGVAVSFDDSQFIINVISTDKMTINYMIFK